MTHVRSGSACAGKIGYGSRQEAKHILRIVNRTRSGQRYVYRCPTCGLWHLGKKVRKQDARNAGHQDLKRKRRQGDE